MQELTARPKKRERQHRSRVRQTASVDRMENVKAISSPHRAHETQWGIHGLSKKQPVEGLKRYWVMSKEERVERRRRILDTQKPWWEKMKQEGTYEAYRTRLNAHRGAQTAAKRQAMRKEAYSAYQHQRYVRRRDHE